MKTGPSARCFRQGSERWMSRTYPSVGSGAGCYERRCVHDNSSGSYQLHVAVEPGVWVPCIDNEMVPLPSQYFYSGSLGPCPVAKDYCLQNNCLNDCSGNGHCFNGTCYCFPSYGDYDCSKNTCFPSSCSSGKVCDDYLGVCRLENEVPPRPQSILPPMTSRDATESADPPQSALCDGTMKFSWSGTVNSTTSVFQREFEQALLHAAEKQSSSASFSGEVKVAVDLVDGDSAVSLSAVQSLTVNYVVKFVPKHSLSSAQNAAELLKKLIANDPQSIFSGNPYFDDKGNVTVTRNEMTSPGSGSQNGLLPNSIPKKILGIKTVYFALVVGLVLSSLISLLCCCTCFGGKGKRDKYYHRQNLGYPGMRPYPSSAPPARTVYAS
ncbi:hypothetical protein CBR_g38920 [Chara braunii]|uniref:EGF-like domain-containing protein n=1 Tax=Chara braunii TaxID=69332 RepID=A0A388LQM3_CHABU|nr:hypothetical protein CBR_g38920 [Chara braunii]|eukprot:GBG84638.1 hypothetical protein CBR_g38920 [Chara braunii]